MNRKNRLLQALLLSLLIHFLFGSTASLLFPRFVPPTAKSPLSVDLVEEKPRKMTAEERKAQQMVRAAQVPKQLLDADKKVDRRYLSKDRQTVLEETRAAESGMTANRTEKSQKQTARQQQIKRIMTVDPIKNAALKQAHLRSFESGDIEVEGLEKQQRLISQEQEPEPESKPLPLPNYPTLPLDQGFSTTGEKLPDSIKVGRFTALNTDRYLYYAFYARAEELFRPHWEKYVRAAMFTYQAQHKTQGNELWTSRLEILLDSQGRFVKGILRESSGLHSLDLAPVQAFQDAARIPNPPPEMVKSDGLIHMDYEFTVEMSPQFAVGG